MSHMKNNNLCLDWQNSKGLLLSKNVFADFSCICGKSMMSSLREKEANCKGLVLSQTRAIMPTYKIASSSIRAMYLQRSQTKAYESEGFLSERRRYTT